MKEFVKLQKNLKKLDSKLWDINTEISKNQSEFWKLHAERKQLRKDIEVLHPDPQISDSAFIDYLKKVEGYDFSKIKNLILTDTVIKQMKKQKAGSIQVNILNKNWNLIIDNNEITNINYSGSEWQP